MYKIYYTVKNRGIDNYGFKTTEPGNEYEMNELKFTFQ